MTSPVRTGEPLLEVREVTAHHGQLRALDNVSLEVELITPVAMDKGLRFAIREGGRTVGAGTVTEILK